MSDGYGRSATSPISRRQAIRLIIQTCLEEGVTDQRQIAYVLATAQHESQNFTSLEEDHGRKQAAKKGYAGNQYYEDNEIRGLSGEEYFGRGYAHLTHADNYRRLGEALGRGNELLDNPALAADPEIASRVLVVGMRDDLFTQRGRGLDHYITADNADYVNARRIVNGIDRAADIAALARAREPEIADLVASVQRYGVDLTPESEEQEPATPLQDFPLQLGDANARVFELQQYLAALNITNDAGHPLSADGDFGPSTKQAVDKYQQALGIDPQTGTVDELLFERIRSQVLQADPDFRIRTIMDLHGPLNDRILAPGDRGDAVTDVQKQLRRLDYRGNDGQPLRVNSKRLYDSDTQTAVRSFQRDENIVPANGLADEQTRDALNARAVERGLPEAIEVIRRREEARGAQQPRQESAHEGRNPAANHQGTPQPQATAPNGSFVDRYFAAIMAGDTGLADRIAIEFLQTREVQPFVQQGSLLSARQHALAVQPQPEEQQTPRQGPVMQM